MRSKAQKEADFIRELDHQDDEELAKLDLYDYYSDSD